MRTASCGMWALIAAGLLVANCTAHPTHVGFAEAQWNPDTGRLELAVRLVAEHLEDALQQFTSDDGIRLEHAAAEASIRDYVRNRFQVRVDAHQPAGCDCDWIGMEVQTQDAWLYLEVKLPHDWEQLTVSNRLLFDVVPRQVNLLNLRFDGQTKTLVFSPDGPQRRLHRHNVDTSTQRK